MRMPFDLRFSFMGYKPQKTYPLVELIKSTEISVRHALAEFIVAHKSRFLFNSTKYIHRKFDKESTANDVLPVTQSISMRLDIIFENSSQEARRKVYEAVFSLLIEDDRLHPDILEKINCVELEEKLSKRSVIADIFVSYVFRLASDKFVQLKDDLSNTAAQTLIEKSNSAFQSLCPMHLERRKLRRAVTI
jgi:hypothetical protein